MFRLLKKVTILIISIPSAFAYCLLLKNQECSVRKVIIGNDYMTFPYKISVERCIGSCNDKNNPFLKFCLPDSIKSISVKSFNQGCKCGCLLDENICNNLQKWNKDQCKCECLKIKDCDIGYSWNVNNSRCEMKKMAALTVESERFLETEECDVETDEIKNVSKYKAFPENKTITLIKKVKDCKPFIGVSILFLCV